MRITKSRRPLWTAVAGLGVGLVLAGGTVGCRSTGTAGAGPAGATPSPAGAPSSPVAASPTAPASPAGAGPADCAAANLAFQSVSTGFASGNRYDVVMVVNRGAASCQLSGLPRLLYTDASGRIQPVPAEPEATDVPPDDVAPGGTAHFAIHTVNGYAGYDPSSPHCAHPAHYQGLLLDRPGGRVPLGSVRIDVLCDGVSISGWGWPEQ